MDETLRALMKLTPDEDLIESPEEEFHITFRDDVPDTIQLAASAGAETRSYQLKPLAELYGKGTGVADVNPRDTFMPLFLGIEEAIMRHDKIAYTTDSAVAFALNQLGLSPDAPTSDPIAAAVQRQLRLVLSFNDYSRAEVRTALRTIGRSVKRHSAEGGARGYLNFVRQQLGRR
jgi:hypothetical protein